MTPGSLRQRVAGGGRAVGGILRMPNESLVELAGYAGLDFVMLDCEHGPADQLALQHHIAAADATGLAALVRVGAADAAVDAAGIQRALDLGAAGVVAPHVSSAQRARELVAAARYRPLGRRGFATYTRAGRYGLATPEAHLASAAERTMVIAMIEDGDGVESAGEIAAVDGVDGIFVGPADLALALGATGAGRHSGLPAATRRVHEAARQRGRALVRIVGSAAEAREALRDGTGMVVYNLQAMLTGLLREAASVVQESAAHDAR